MSFDCKSKLYTIYISLFKQINAFGLYDPETKGELFGFSYD